jgi:hypothetical protein
VVEEKGRGLLQGLLQMAGVLLLRLVLKWDLFLQKKQPIVCDVTSKGFRVRDYMPFVLIETVGCGEIAYPRVLRYTAVTEWEYVVASVGGGGVKLFLLLYKDYSI